MERPEVRPPWSVRLDEGASPRGSTAGVATIRSRAGAWITGSSASLPNPVRRGR